LSKEDLRELEQRLYATDILVLSDEAYEHLVYDGRTHESVARYPDLTERSLICASFGKTFHVTGWKTGYCAAPAGLMKEFRKIHEFNVFAINHPVQRALAKYLRQPENYLGLPGFFQEKRDFFLEAVRESRFSFTSCHGTYLQLLDYRNITEEGDVAFAIRISREYGLDSIPISVFNERNEDNQQLRFCFAKN